MAAWIPSVGAEFGLIDDHQIVQILGSRSRLPIIEIPEQILNHTNEQTGRFRPLYWVGQVLESSWAGNNATLWYIDRLFLAVLTLSTLYVLARRYCSPAWSGALALGVLLGPQFEVWSRLGAAETYAMPLFSIGLLLLVRSLAAQDLRMALVGTSALIASALAKEAFLPFAAAALVSVSPMLRRRATARGWLAAGLLGLLVTADAAIVLVQVVRFGDQYAQIRTPATAMSWTSFAMGNAFVFQALGAALVIVMITRSRQRPRAHFVALVLAGFASQIAFYAGGDHMGRYLLPGAVAFMTCWILALRCSERTPHLVMAAAACLLGLSLALGALSSFRIAQTNADSSRRFQVWLHGLERQLRVDDRPTTVIIEPVDPYLDYERVLSIAEYLRSDLSIEVMTTTAANTANDARGQHIARALSRASSGGTADGLIEPFAQRAHCVSVLLGNVSPVCSSSVSFR